MSSGVADRPLGRNRSFLVLWAGQSVSLVGSQVTVVAVPLVAVTNTVVGYLRSYSQEQTLKQSPRPRGATAADIAPLRDAGLTSQDVYALRQELALSE